jgi:hypothetical protein
MASAAGLKLIVYAGLKLLVYEALSYYELQGLWQVLQEDRRMLTYADVC